jgi:Tol biopolymer transport system component
MPDEDVVPGLWTQLFVRKSTKSLDMAIPLATFKGPVTLSMPMFSPDDRQICYEVAPQRPNVQDKQRGIYVVSAGGGKSRLIYTPTAKPARNCWPAWTDSGKSIALVDGPDLVWVNPATKAVQRKPDSWILGEQAANTRVTMLRPNPRHGDQFAFTTGPAPGSPFETRHSMVYLGRPGEPPHPVSGTGNAWHPRWTPDGKALLFYRVAPGQERADLVAYDLSTNSEATLYRP